MFGRSLAQDLLQVAGDAGVEDLALLTEDARVGCLLGQRVLEDVLAP